MKYRPEIDGLRALAVLPVLFFHAGFSLFRGGYIGVDIFFVISGYLITSIILNENQSGSFSIVNFYERRARRILPALFMVLAVCTIAAWLWLFPMELIQFGECLIAVALFFSNVFLGLKVGYFAPISELSPLIHTWSLAVEEQFYFLYPILLTFVWRFARRWLTFVILLGISVSLATAEYLSKIHLLSNFFFSPSRAWELLLGAFVTVKTLPDFGVRGRNIFSSLGICLMLAPVFCFDQLTPTPTLHTLIPTLGTALILAFGREDTWVGRFCRFKAFVAIGIISYPLYLWHQALFAFAKERMLQHPSEGQFLGLIFLSLLLAYFTWRFLERPCRDKEIVTKRYILRGAVYLSLGFIFLGSMFFFQDGFPGRFSKSVLNSLKYSESNDYRLHESRGGKWKVQNVYRMGKQNELPRVILWGDSFAGSIAFSLNKSLGQKGIGGLCFSCPGCPPITGVYRADCDESHSANYQKFNSETLDFIMGNNAVTTVVLMARWSMYTEGTPPDNLEGGVEGGRPLRLLPLLGAHSEGERREKIKISIIQTVQKLLSAGKDIVLVYPIPELGYDVPKANAKEILYGCPPVSISRYFYNARNKFILNVFNSLPVNRRMKRIFPVEVFFDPQRPERCGSVLNGKTLYRDYSHLSEDGADLLVSEIMKAI